MDLENISRNVDLNTTLSQAKKEIPPQVDPMTETERVDMVAGNDADVNEDDLVALGGNNLRMDDGDDEQLKNRVYPSIMGDSDLDIPGADLDDDIEFIGSEDEENNYYSLGGDKSDDLEASSD
jgi:hypothetical protein